MWNTHVKVSHQSLLGFCFKPQNQKGSSAWQQSYILHSKIWELLSLCTMLLSFFISGPMCASESLSAMAESSMFSCARLLFTYSFLKEPRTFPHRAAERPTVAPKYRVAHSNWVYDCDTSCLQIISFRGPLLNQTLHPVARVKNTRN